MARNLQLEAKLRPVDLARAHGLSTQAVRNYEDAGILPVAERTPVGYRVYTPRHADALDAFLALVPGHGHQGATSIMQAVNRGDIDGALRLVDEAHLQLVDDRRTLRAVELALDDLAPEPPEAPEPPVPPERLGGGDTFIGPLAHRLGLRPATLRKWERAGLVAPRRDAETGYRVYGPADVRDAKLVHQLRRGGYLLDQIAPVIGQVRDAGSVEALAPLLRDWHTRLTTRSLALLTGAAALATYLAADRSCAASNVTGIVSGATSVRRS